MPHRNSAALARPAARSHRVLYHPHVCPDCDSASVGQADVDTGDGITETALICRDCGTAWPVACVTDWQYPAQPDITGYEHDPELAGGRLW